MVLLALALAFVILAAPAALAIPWRRPARARLNAEGIQEIEVLVYRRYRPDRILVKRDIPVCLRFRRQEDVLCSEHVIFSHAPLAVRLPPFWTTSVTFAPEECGDHLFTCQMGVYQGCLLVREASVAEWRQVEEAQRHALSRRKGVKDSDDWYQPDHSAHGTL